ncbi:MAG: RluA family pseudouridine synthase [Verrucomicrobiae bacterium]|nr:RluA family pseudouridine synthase [Verrucomicrobiae bacterium]
MTGADSTVMLPLSREWRVDVLYEDRALLAINKPAGLIAAPESWSRTRRNLMRYLQEGIQRRAYWAVSRGIRWIKNVHRIDADTSGILLLAKTPVALERMSDLWEHREVEKEYIALVEGAPRQTTLEIVRGIAPHPKREGLMVIDDKHGKPAQTFVSLREQFAHHALLSAKPATGRTHQIRIHLASVGLPIVSDPLYGSGRPGPMPRLGLHAARLRFVHPFTHQPVEIEAPWPTDLREAVARLRRERGISDF